MAKRGTAEELVERGNGAEGLAPPAAKYFFSPSGFYGRDRGLRE